MVRNNPTDQGESLSVIFDNCHIQNSTISGGSASGKFVGAISGYDNGESISFSSNCIATDCTVSGAASSYVEGGKACWLAANDFSAYNAWLGGQTYGRANVSFGGQTFSTKWGG